MRKKRCYWSFVQVGIRKDHNLYRCVCGEVREVYKYSVSSGASRSCGCKKPGWTRKALFRKDADVHRPEYRCWVEMRRRCRKSNRKESHRYVGRGIRVCERWQGEGGFKNFLADTGSRPSGEHQIDRINNDGDYEPGNVRWAVPLIQQRNRGNNVVLTLDGRSQCVSAWAAEIGIRHYALRLRIKKWGLRKALTTPKIWKKGTR